MKIFQVALILVALFFGYGTFGNLTLNCSEVLRYQSPSSEQIAVCQESNITMGTTFGVITLISLGIFGWTYASKKGFFEGNNPVYSPTQFAQAPNLQNPVKTASSATGNIETELQKAKEMLDKGLIDEAEYKTLKAKIISGG